MSYRELSWEEESIQEELRKVPHNFLSVNQAAEVLQVNPLTVKRWIWKVELPAWNTRDDGKGHWRIAKKSLEEFVQNRNSMNIEFN
ncbi:helix-turn-helix domain-containing protein [Limisalsivibrio acetivorans]|uniref:helix-turn-helix domain-containing protein n=1 Tax=Limisalsivibrio acetivorans TaxID=1304888 RepID=UPI0003B4DBB7|nr:helix-turn-helix domain-containing protein [Limisalsivibrio acetivorans]